MIRPEKILNLKELETTAKKEFFDLLPIVYPTTASVEKAQASKKKEEIITN